MNNEIYSIIDTETTGLSPYKNRIIDIAIISVKNGKVINKFETLINPNTRIPKFISAYTGIKQEHIEDAPNFYEVNYKIKDLIENTTVVAHNANFDMSFLNEEFKRVDLHLTLNYLCTINLCRNLYPVLKRRNLDTVASHFDIKIKNRHRAMGDALATADIFIKMQQENTVIWEIILEKLKKNTNQHLKRYAFNTYPF